MVLIQAYLWMCRKYYLAASGKFNAESIKLADILKPFPHYKIPELYSPGGCVLFGVDKISLKQ